MQVGLPVIITLIILSGILSSAEIALTSLTEPKMRTMEEEKRFGIKAIRKLKSTPQHLLISILVGNQLVNIVATVTATMWGISLFGQNNVSIVTAVFSVMLILFGAISPKSIALVSPERNAQIIAYPLLAFILILKPVTWIFEILNTLILKAFRVDKKEMPSITSKEIEATLSISAETGVLEKESEALMQQVLKFNETTAGDIMTVNKNLTAINEESDKKVLDDVIANTNRTHFPVYRENLDNIIGVIEIHNLVDIIKKSRKKKPLKDWKSKYISVPKTTSINELFKQLKENSQRLAVVIDEHGQTVGVVTLGDILSEMIGERIESEEKKTEIMIKKLGTNKWEAKGEATIDQINKELDIKLPYSQHQTVSLAILEALKRFPEAEEKICMDHIEIKIDKLGKKTIDRIIIRKAENTNGNGNGNGNA